jgi:hypothetical protein
MIRALAIAAALAASTGVAAASHCKETSPIVGRQACGRFGSRWAHRWWDNRMLNMEGSLVVDRVALPVLDRTGRVYSASGPAGYHAQVAPGARRTLWSVGPRVWFGYRGEHLELGLDLTPTFAIAPPTLITVVDGFPPIHAASGFVGDLVAVAGAHTRVAGFTLGGALAVGEREVSLMSPLPAGFTTCANGEAGNRCDFGVYEFQPLVELRARADAWLTPHTTLGGAIGVDLIRRGETFAITVAFHAATFDGS